MIGRSGLLSRERVSRFGEGEAVCTSQREDLRAMPDPNPMPMVARRMDLGLWDWVFARASARPRRRGRRLVPGLSRGAWFLWLGVCAGLAAFLLAW